MALVGEQDFQSLVLGCNKDGMEALKGGMHQAAFEQFKYAEAILISNQAEGDHSSLLAVTCNNLGCYYKKVGKFHGALSYLRRALKMEVDLNTPEVTLAGTHLNICAILSKLGKHDKAVQHAMSALELMNQLMSVVEAEEMSKEDYAVLAIAYHNVALEREFLHQDERAATAFKQAYQVASAALGEEHPLSISLGQQCDALLAKIRKNKAVEADKRKKSKKRQCMVKAMDARLGLPSVPTDGRMGPSLTEVSLPMPTSNSVCKDTIEWMEKEERAWYTFARSATSSKRVFDEDGNDSTQNPRSLEPLPPPQPPETPESVLPLFTSTASERIKAREHDWKELVDPSFEDSLHFRDGVPSDVPFSPSVRMQQQKTPLAQALDAQPSALIDIIDAQTSNNGRTAPNDYRPNRVIKGSTRTSLVVRRTGIFNSTKHRDEVMDKSKAIKNPGRKQKSDYQQGQAAASIQRVWRAYREYCKTNANWLTTSWICATMIQANWRAYHVKRVKLDRAARTIQRHVRGKLVRRALRSHNAAISIQRHVIGMITRVQMKELHDAAIKLQSLTRGSQARKRVRQKRAQMTKTALTLQCMLRQGTARRLMKQRQERLEEERIQLVAIIDLQRMFRGWKGRQIAAARKKQYMHDLWEYNAATKLQSMVRRDLAARRVDGIRATQLKEMNKAATFLRKMWMGARSRKKFQELRNEFRAHEDKIITIQRFARGFVTRLRLWREAVRAEEELWAAIEMQRAWRGYKGRVRWENFYEVVWRREMAAVVLQLNVRGWVARKKVHRARRKIARAEFERARRRFRAAQRIQAWARGKLARKRFNARRQRLQIAAVAIQRIARGHALRVRLWQQVIELRATMIGAHARGFLVRNRRFQLVAKTICIQNNIRAWQRQKPGTREQARETMRDRKTKAAAIQDAFRKHAEKKSVVRAKHSADWDRTQLVPAAA